MEGSILQIPSNLPRNQQTKAFKQETMATEKIWIYCDEGVNYDSVSKLKYVLESLILSHK